ncbi:DUF5916 domain-containing protein [uncultured Psychroserpens sp.]|uniref:carbohydrate binding family 9 domain-containing protein n=1 Tax=uncultured Psychroserpens sp. TaxID=255436 RepID=UPI00260E37AA|nr:DUF5916 domain-containing protein [uncultured Psychroserpens sp.]
MLYRQTFIFFFLISFLAFSQDDLTKSNAPIQLDGVLNETSWDNAFEFNGFKQIEPNLGANTTEKVIVKFMYDDQYLYVGAYCYFKDPNQIFAATLERDKTLDNDDYVEVHIDSYNDKLNTLVFRTNPLSARQDFEVNRNGDVFNLSWNTFWDAKSKINDDGWSAEMRIPFSSLRYNVSSENIMRIKAIVNYKQKNERVIAPQNNTELVSAQYHFSNSEEVRFKNLPRSKPLYITPYVKANVISQNQLNADETAYENETAFLEEKGYASNETLDKVLSNLGLDIKYKPNANQTIDFSINTDFAEVEADDRIINISRFPIFLPEKRLFFLENADLFNSNLFGHRLFNSRRIGIEDGQAIPIIAGLRYAGNSSKWQYGLLSMQTHKVEGVALSNNMSVTRLRYTIGNFGSNIGIINTNKINRDKSNHLVAIDANIRFSDNIRTRFTVGSTFDDVTGNWKSMYGAEINTFRANGFGINYRFREYTKDFNPELGFVPRPDTKRLTLNNGWRRTYTNSTFLRYLTLGHYFNKFWVSSTGQHEFFQTNIYLTAIHKKGARFTMFFPIYQEDNLYQDWNISEGINIPANQYVMWKINPIFDTGRARAYRANLDIEVGEFYGGNQFTTNLNVSYDFSQLFKAEIGGTYNQLRFPESYAVDTSRKINLSRYFTRLKFNFSSKSSLNSFFQYDTRTEKLGLNLRFRFNPIEGTDLYIVYNHNANINRDSLTPRLPFTDNQVFILKYSKTFLN